jgi:predicted O-linked N-acetylglucosamine transferase (SPINDLY family)
MRLLGVIAHKAGRNDIAVDLIRRAIALRPNFAEAYCNLGIALAANEQLDEAVAAFRQAIALRPNYAEAQSNLGVALASKEQLDDAIVAFRQAIVLRPNYAKAHNNLGLALADKGQLDDAIAACRRAIALNPNLPEVHSNLVFTLHYSPAYDAQAIAEELRRWNRQHAEPLRKFIQSHSNDRSPDRSLRIGYVSPDFLENPVGRFLLPLLAHHDHQNFQIVCYANVQRPDALTPRLQGHADIWRSTVGLTDEQLATQIRQDQIDILVDLTMHAASNRLLVFARKPAPVQVMYLAYCSSTGLDTIDYRLSDPYLDPPGEESFYSEQTIHLPDTFWCYQSIIDCPQVGPLPALAQGVITFGCLNQFTKVSEPTLGAWAKLLRAVPNSQLLLCANKGSHRERLQQQLQREGIEPNRVRFTGRVPLRDYFRLYHGIDIALDTFPYAGGTTTCDALWMGVPVVSLVGRTGVSRGGLSILSNVGLPELVARSEEQYVRIANELADNLPHLSQLRSTLRQRMEQSPLMDAPQFARDLEAAYRRMWHTWCETASAKS